MRSRRQRRLLPMRRLRRGRFLDRKGEGTRAKIEGSQIRGAGKVENSIVFRLLG